MKLRSWPVDRPVGTLMILLSLVVLGMVAIACLYLAPMYLVGNWYCYAALCTGVALVAIGILKCTWYDKL